MRGDICLDRLGIALPLLHSVQHGFAEWGGHADFPKLSTRAKTSSVRRLERQIQDGVVNK